VVVPAKLTWLLQPCDTHVFAHYKRYLRHAHQESQGGAPDGRVTTTQWLRLIVRTIIHVLESTDWSKAFEEDGYLEWQTRTSKYILEHLDPTALLPADALEPSAELLQDVAPRGAAGHRHALTPQRLLPREPAAGALADAPRTPRSYARDASSASPSAEPDPDAATAAAASAPPAHAPPEPPLPWLRPTPARLRRLPEATPEASR
jgi:hypothetical protein